MARDQNQGQYGQMQIPAMLSLPAQQLGDMFVENLRNVLDYQLGLSRSYTHFALAQWRDALEVRDPQSLQQYLQKQSQSVQELTQQTREGTQQFLQTSQEAAQRGLQRVQSAANAGAQVAHQVAEQAERSSARAARSS
jgi:hypothetical protein